MKSEGNGEKMHEQKNTNQQKNQYSASSEKEQAIYLQKNRCRKKTKKIKRAVLIN